MDTNDEAMLSPKTTRFPGNVHGDDNNDEPHKSISISDFASSKTANNEDQPQNITFADDLKPGGTDNAQRKFSLTSIKTSGPSKTFFNPTSVRMNVKWQSRDYGTVSRPATAEDNSKEVELLWRSRDNRKGRNSIAVPRRPSIAPTIPPKRGTALKRQTKLFASNLRRMFFTFQYWDMAYWSGWSYTIGSAIFVADGAFGWLPVAFPDSVFPGQTEYVVGIFFFIGTLFFELGATMAYLEAVNDGSFQGSALRRFLDGHDDDQKKLLDDKLHTFFGHFVPTSSREREQEASAEKRANEVDPEIGWTTRDRAERPGSIYPQHMRPTSTRRGGIDFGEAEQGETYEYLTWRWYPTWHCLKTHHIFEIGYIACAVQLFGATIYCMTGIVALPGVLSSLNVWQANCAYWMPQIVASCCFLSAGLLFTLETQSKWYKPEPKTIGWWIGAWATIGSVGFLLCGALGPASYTSTKASYQSALSSMWGSAGYLTSSLLQWYEAVYKDPNIEGDEAAHREIRDFSESVRASRSQ